ncbi:MAG TPA: SGNH/GDSL hydrolase family protein [Acidimicrobiia bacterium]|nr:SGNH/GDSL hydrolase family protein [Acidimicrobiia bacterium]
MRAAVTIIVAGALAVSGCGGSGKGPVVTVVGDSITVYSAPGVEAELNGYALYIRAVDGKRIDQMLPVVRADLTRKPDAVVINLGTNDAIQARIHPEWLAGFNALWDLVRTRRCVVFVTVSTNADDLGGGTVAADIDHALRQLAGQHRNVRLVDWNRAVHEDPSLLASRYPPEDHIHPYSLRAWRWLGNRYRSALLSCGLHPN